MGKKNAAAESDGLSKKERRALAEKEAALMAELDARADEAASRKVKPSKKDATESVELGTLKRKALKKLADDRTNGDLRKAAKAELKRRDAAWAEAIAADRAAAEPVKPSPKAKTAAAAEKVLASHSTEGARESAEDALAAANEADDTESDEAIRARVLAKRAARAAKAGLVSPDLAAPDSARRADALPGESEVAYQQRKAGWSADDVDAVTEQIEAEQRAQGENDPTSEHYQANGPMTAEVVETETGSVIAVGSTAPVAAADDFAKPSEAPRADYETNGNGQYKVKRPEDGKIVGYTRVTTYISTNEDRTMLEKWKLRILLEGVAVHDTAPGDEGGSPEPVVARVSDLIHQRDVTIAKALKADRKGKLSLGQFRAIEEGAWSDFKKALNVLGEEMLELGGVHVKAMKGTELHELFELHDREGIDAVGDLLTEGKITPADLADVEAYARAIEAAGITFTHIEQPIVVDDLKVAGRLDRVAMCKLPGAARAGRYILDAKSGRIDLGAGKIAQQIEMYSRGKTYDLDTHERGEHKASRTKGLVLHITPGSAEAHIYVVDLSVGRLGNDLSGKVRAFRNDGKRAIDQAADLTVQPEAVA